MFNPQGSIIQNIVFQKHIYVTNLQLLKYVTLFIFLCSSLEGGKPKPNDHNPHFANQFGNLDYAFCKIKFLRNNKEQQNSKDTRLGFQNNNTFNIKTYPPLHKLKRLHPMQHRLPLLWGTLRK